jgi:hypothetical protein
MVPREPRSKAVTNLNGLSTHRSMHPATKTASPHSRVAIMSDGRRDDVYQADMLRYVCEAELP